MQPIQATRSDRLRSTKNGHQGSRYFGRIDPKARANTKDPRIATVVIMNSGVFNAGPTRMGGIEVGKELLADLHTPTLYILGGPTDIAYANGMDDFARISNVPVAVANIDTGHGGTYWDPNGGAAAQVAVQWLDWRYAATRMRAARSSARSAGSAPTVNGNSSRSASTRRTDLTATRSRNYRAIAPTPSGLRRPPHAAGLRRSDLRYPSRRRRLPSLALGGDSANQGDDRGDRGECGRNGGADDRNGRNGRRCDAGRGSTGECRRAAHLGFGLLRERAGLLQARRSNARVGRQAVGEHTDRDAQLLDCLGLRRADLREPRWSANRRHRRCEPAELRLNASERARRRGPTRSVVVAESLQARDRTLLQPELGRSR